jgi:hypothetical protein
MSRIQSILVSGTIPPLQRLRPTCAGSLRLSVPGRARKAMPRCLARRGYMLFEVQMAFVVLGIGLAGLCPLVVMQQRQVRMLEMRLRGQVTETSRITGVSQPMVIKSGGVTLPTPIYYIVPWKNPWTQKLAGSAQILPSTTNQCDIYITPSTTTQNTVSVVGPLTIADSQSVTAYVDITSP